MRAIDGQARQSNDKLTARATILVLAATAVPLVVALISVSREKWYPTGDMAQAELHVAGFLRHPPLVGAAGRIGSPFVPYGQGSHPGPALWVALLPFYLLTGRSSFGIELGMTLLQSTFIVSTVLAVRRLFGAVGGLVVASAAAVLVHSLGPAPFIEPWNPWGALFAFFCFVALCWGVVCGHHRWLPAAAFAGYFAVQCHVGYALLVGAALVAMVGFVTRQWRRAPSAEPDPRLGGRSAILRSGAITIAVTVVMWLPPLIDQIRRRPGNLRILWNHFTASSNPDGSPRAFVGMSAALKAFAGEFAVPGPWIRGPFRDPADSPNLLTFALAVATVAVIVTFLLRHRDVPHSDLLIKLFALLGLMTIVGIVSMSRIIGEFFDYVIRWWWILIAWVLVACLLTLARIVRERWVVLAAVTLALAMSGLATANAVGQQNPGPRNSHLVGGVVPQITDHLDRDAHYLMRWLDPATLGGVPFGVLLELEKRGFHVGVDSISSAGALPHRVLPESSANAVLWVMLGDPNIALMRARSDAVELGYFDERTAAEIAESDQLREQLIARLLEHDLDCVVATIDTQYGLAQFVLGTAPVPPDVADIAYRYGLLGLPVAIFELPRDAPPPQRPAVAGC